MGIGRNRVLQAIVFFAVLWAFSGFSGDRVHAEDVLPEWGDLTHCTISGSDRVIVDYLCGDGISEEVVYLYLGYDPETGRLYPFWSDGSDFEPMDIDGMMILQTNTDGLLEVLFQNEEEVLATADRLCGSRGFNHFGVQIMFDDETYNAGEGKLVDTDGDGKADAVLLEVNGVALSRKKAGQVQRLLGSELRAAMSIPLEYFQDGSNNFWVIPCDMGGGDEYFVPVFANRDLLIQCGDERALITSEATVDGDGECIVPVPTLRGWGYAGLIFLILASGIWMMRRKGFGRGLTKN
ncbi:MAG: hypothetical protein JRF65_10580 [Deltaproteobacteria bacterium]|nr:hypothetical protein [Deltaproteobacteria bacterium]